MIVKDNKVYSFKMNSGEEIVALVVKTAHDLDRTWYEVEAPLGTMPSAQGVQLIPAMFSIDHNGNASIYTSSVAMISLPREDMLNAYRESTTGIKVPDKKILLS